MTQNRVLENEVFEIIDGDFRHGFLLIADHASNNIPIEYKGLGLDDEQLKRHIAYDIGVKQFTLRLAKKLNVPAVMGTFSRLLIDPNRGMKDPTLVMRVSDGKIIDGNRDITEDGKLARIERFYKPYDAAISGIINEFDVHDVKPTLLAIHSFTPYWRGHKRATEVGLLWNEEQAFTTRIVDALRATTNYVVHDNQPYRGGMPGDTMDRHGLDKGLEHSLLELRQDYMGTEAGINEWVDIFAGILPQIVKNYKKQ
ncbi:MAG: N-formylglutamate amidohydrolase [Alphaproteobacteria bacterium]|nr:N-formylglutamate amidohydrolase [Alphaproteobacteria bacterium]